MRDAEMEVKLESRMLDLDPIGSLEGMTGWSLPEGMPREWQNPTPLRAVRLPAGTPRPKLEPQPAEFSRAFQSSSKLSSLTFPPFLSSGRAAQLSNNPPLYPICLPPKNNITPTAVACGELLGMYVNTAFLRNDIPAPRAMHQLLPDDCSAGTSHRATCTPFP